MAAVLTGLVSWLGAGSCRLQGLARCFLCSQSVRNAHTRGSLGSLSIVPSRSTSSGPGNCGPGAGLGAPLEQELQVAAPAADAQWGLGRTEGGSHSPCLATTLVVGAFFFFRFAFKKIIISQLLAGIWVPWLRQDTDRKHTQSLKVISI